MSLISAAANIGSIQVKESSAPSTPASGYGRLYENTSGQLCFIDDAGSTSILTNIVPANIVAYFTGAVASIPTGWTELTAARGRMIVGVPSGGTVAGTVGTALTNLQDKTHSHTYTDVINHTHTSELYSNLGAQNHARNSDDVTQTGTITTSNPSGGVATGTTATKATSDVLAYIQYPTVVKS